MQVFDRFKVEDKMTYGKYVCMCVTYSDKGSNWIALCCILYVGLVTLDLCTFINRH